METNPYQTPVADPQPPPSSPPPLLPRLGIKQILFSFQGRIPRRTYWLWRVLSMVVLVVLLSLIAPLLAVGVDQTAEDPGLNPIASILMVVLIIPFGWISLALFVKRWHDRGKSGMWVLIGLIPIAGPIWSFVECGCLRGTLGHNPYGSDPT